MKKFLKTLLPPPKFTISTWADNERYLSPESAEEPGLWDTNRAFYQRGMMDALSERGVEKVVFMTSAQVGKTSILENIIGYYIAHDPAPMMMVQPTLQMAQAFSKDRLSPMFRDTPCLSDKVATSRTKDGTNTQLHKQFKGGHLTLSGANSPASLASRPIRILLCDEVSRWPKSAGTEGSPLHLAQKRTTTFYNKKIIMCSTPGIKGDCVIADEYENSDQRKFHVPCPQCSFMQTLVWENLRYEKNQSNELIEASVRYECQSCKALLPEIQKQKMLSLGSWVTKKETNNVAGFHINELYSPWRKWHEVIKDFLQSVSQPERHKVWVNTSLGLPYEPLGSEQPDWRELYNRRERYDIGTAPSSVRAITAGVDTQKDRLEMTVVGWRKRECWIIDHIVLPGNPQDPKDKVWADLFEIIERPWLTEDGRHLKILKCATDAAYAAASLYDVARASPTRAFMLIKGRDNQDTPLGTPKRMELTTLGKRIKTGPLLWPVGVNILKSDLYARFTLPMPTEDEQKSTGFPPSFIHFPELHEHYFKQMCAESFSYSMHRGVMQKTWVQNYPRNEALDCLVYATAAFFAAGLQRWPESKWK